MDVPIEKKRFKPYHIFLLIGILLVVAGILYVLKSNGAPSKLNIVKERLTISQVSAGVFQENIPVNGVVLPITTIYIDVQEGGRVEDVYQEDGTIVKKGEPILRLSNTDLELSLINQETAVYNLLTQMQISQNAARQNTINKLNQFTDIENTLIEANRIYTLNESLYKQKAIGKQDYLEAKNNLTYQKERLKLINQVLQQDSIARSDELMQAQNSYARTNKALGLMQRKVGDLIVKAPIDGQLTSLSAEIGQSKIKGERLGQVDVLDGFKVRADIDEHYISRIYTGQQGTYILSGDKYVLVIKKVYTQVVNGRFQVDMLFEGRVPPGIRRGQTLQLQLALSDEKQAIMIPKGGFFQSSGGNWIFKLNENEDMAYRVDIRIGNQNTEFYEVIQGLSPNEKVITSNYDNYKDIHELILN